MIQASCQRRDALRALLLGAPIAFVLNIWFNVVATSQAIDSHFWLARLQEPGSKTGELLARVLQPIIGYPWNVGMAVTAAYVVLTGMWALIMLGSIVLGRASLAILRSFYRRTG